MTATVKPAVEGRTIATDWRILPPGTKVYIDGLGEFVVDDSGVEGDTIDIYYDVDDDTLNDLGVRIRPIYIMEWGA
jgi:3D (Asp-Asp-Asp) domain-containing protein